MTRFIKFLVILGVFASLIVSSATPARAYISAPTSIAIEYVHVNRNLVHAGDQLFYARYNIAYSSVPSVSIYESFIFRLIAADNVTELAANLAYPYINGGYGQGIISFYFENATAPAWGGDYYIRVSGNPTQFTTPPLQQFIISTSSYTSKTTEADNRDELTTNMLVQANTLSTSWAVTLTTTSTVGTVFNDYGEAYFPNAISGLRIMAPALFLVQLETPDYTARTWSTNQSAAYEARYDGTDMKNRLTDFGDLFSQNFSMIGGIFVLVLSLLFIIAALRLEPEGKQGGSPVTAGLLCAAAFVPMGTVMGWTPFAMMALGTVFCILYIGIKRLLKA